MSEDYVLDSSALLAMLFDEPGADIVADLIQRAKISTVNLSEVVAKLQERGAEVLDIDDTVSNLQIEIVAFSTGHAVQAGKLRAATRSAGLSLGDRACLALAASTGSVAVTTDRAWSELDLPIEVKLVRP